MASSFTISAADLAFILKQIKIGEATSEAYTHTDANGNAVQTVSILQAIMDTYALSVSDAAIAPFGLRTVDGTYNSLLPGQTEFGAADTLFPRLTDPAYRNETDGNSIDFDGGGPAPATVQGNYGQAGNVVDADPRIISNLIVDMSVNNPAAVEAFFNNPLSIAAFEEAHPGMTPVRPGEGTVAVALANASFEANPLTDGAPGVITDALGNYTFAAPTGWAIAGTGGVYAPTDAISETDGHPGPNVAWLTGGSVLSKNTGQLLAAGDSYNLSLNLGDRTDLAWPGGEARLVAFDGLNTVVLQSATLPEPANGQWATVTLNTGAIPEAYAGYLLRIEVRSAGGGGDQILVDSVQLTKNLADHLEITDTDLQTVPNQSPDIGLSPGFNSWMTFFGQFFDHGLDLVTKGNNGTVYIPLQADDPLIAGDDGILNDNPDTAVNEAADNLPPHLQFMALTRATPTMVDPDGAGPLPAVAEHENTTTSFVDQNQTYTSHSSHQVFLREYATVGGKTVSTGRLIDGTTAGGSVDGAIGNWAEVKAQARTFLGIELTDFDVHNVPLLRTDAYGRFIPHPVTGFAQVITGAGPDGILNTADDIVISGTNVTPVNPAAQGALRTGHAFLNDIAHHAAPGMYNSNGDHVPDTLQHADTDPGVGDDGDASTYDDEMLNAHFITGDGRGNENIALTTVHSIFHSEHNRAVEADKATILASGDVAFLNEWLLVDQPENLTAAEVAALNPASLVWDGERLFQAARFTTEMQYQHMVFEEFARRIQPEVDPFVFNSNPEVDASIVAEFAHTVYRFGHSMLTGTVDRLDNDLNPLDPLDPNSVEGQQTLLAMFLNPQAYIGSGATLEEINANLIRGLSRDVGNAIDEFIVTDVRSNLLGLPLDLAVLNISRGRETGIPSLNETRAQLFNDTGDANLKPYTSWSDFAKHITNAASLVNFIAAYGTHATILAATNLADARAAAELLVFGGAGAPLDRIAFLNATGAYAPDGAGPNDDTRGGLNLVDLWIGGLAEAHPEFGGMLGTTFNYVFETQMENLQFGDRMYYLSRTQGTHFLTQLEPNTFSDIVMRNTDLGDIYSTHLNGALFVTPDYTIELDRGIAQTDYNGDADGRDPHDDDNPIVGPQVERDYTGNGDNSANGHDEGGYLRVTGGAHYVLGGTEGNDTIYGDRGIDTLWGDGGDDYLNGRTESDDVFGGLGNDVIEDEFGINVLRGNQGNDVISSSGLAGSLIFGDDGIDYIVLGTNASEVFGGSENDFVLGGRGADLLLGNEGDDWMEGAGGFDTLAGDNSELFFNSPIIGHDVLFGQGDEVDYDGKSGDDIMGSGPSVFRYEGMFGFDWGVAKYDLAGVNFDLAIPIFTSVAADILRDRFDHVEALSGWRFGDTLIGDDRGQVAGAIAPGATPTPLFVDDVLKAENIGLIHGFVEFLDGARTTFGTGADFRDGNILMGGAGSDILQGRGGYDILDGDAWLNVRIKIVHNGVTYSAESMNSDTAVMGQFAGKVFNTDAAGNPIFTSPAFEGRSLTAMILDRTLNPGELSIVREILDGTPGITTDNDTAVFRGNLAEYEIEGRVEGGANAVAAEDLNGDGFISVRDLDNGAVAAPNGVRTRGVLTDNTDLLRNIELLQFADQTIAIGGNNDAATGSVTISDPTPLGGVVTPFIGQVLTATLAGAADADGLTLSGGQPVGLTFEWQAARLGDATNIWETIGVGGTYTVQPADTGVILRAVAVFEDNTGVTERIFSAATLAPTAPFSVVENSGTDTVVGTIPFDFGLEVPAGVDIADPTLVTHVLRVGGDAGGRFKIIQDGVDADLNPVFQLAVANGGPIQLDYEAVQGPVDNQYTIVVDTFDGATLLATRQFTVMLQNIANETAPKDILWHAVAPDSGSAAPGAGAIIATLGTDVLGATYELAPLSSTGFAISAAGVVTAPAAGMLPNSTYTLNVKATYNSPTEGLVSRIETFTIRTGANANVIATLGNNVITMTGADDIVYGLSGNDNLTGGAGDDTLIGQDGNDRLTGGLGNDTYFASRGVNGDGDFDTLVEALDAGTDTVVTADAAFTLAANFENLSYDNGGAADGVFAGTGNGLANIITGGQNNDTLLGVGGTDTLNGGNGNDVLDGGADADVLNGEVGNDTLQGGAGNDVVNGGDGDDILNHTLNGTDTFDGGTGTDRLNITGTAAGNTLTVGFNGTAISGVTGITVTGVEEFTADLLAGTDTLSYGVSASAVTVNLGAGAASGFVSISNIESAIGGSGDDTLTGSGVANALNGGAGNDTLIATVDNVRDTLTGGIGADTANYAAYAAGLTVVLSATGGADVGGSGTGTNTDLLVSVENVTGGSGADAITGNTSANILSGGAGNDTFTYVVGGGADTVDGGADSDTLTINGAAGNDTLSVIFNGAEIVSVGGGAVSGVETVTADLLGNTAAGDTLSYAGSTAAVNVNLGAPTPTASGFVSITNIENVTGGSGDDSLTGSAGANTLIGGIGNDALNGRAGADLLIGGDGANSIFTGDLADANDNLRDTIRFNSVSEFGDTVSNFDATDAVIVQDRVAFGGQLNTDWDDGTEDDNFTFVSGNGLATTTNATVGQLNGNAEGLRLVQSEGIANAADLTNAAVVAQAFNDEFNITAADGEDALLVVNSQAGTNFAVWQWVQANGGEILSNELTLVAYFDSNAAANGTANGTFDFV